MNIPRFTRLFLCIIAAILFPLTVMSNSAAPRRPDFAFPQKVSDDSEKNLERALEKGRDVDALRALINLTLAQNAIDSDRMPSCLARIDSLQSRFASPAMRSLLYLLRATIYTDYYRSQMWTIDRRPATGDSERPDDYTQWNAGQFQACVAELLNAAMANPDALLAAPLRDYDPLLDIPAKDAGVEYTFYPSLLDFVGGSAIELVSSFRTPDARALADEYRATLIRLNASHPAPLIVNRIAQIQNRAQNGDAMRRELIGLYNSSQGSAFCGEALIALGDVTDYDNIDRCRELKALIDGFEERYPTYVRINSIKNIAANILSRRASVEVSSVVAPGDFISFDARAYNIPELMVDIYRLPDSFDGVNDDYYSLEGGYIPPTLRKVASRKLAFAGITPFVAEASDSVRLIEPGYYIAVADAPGMRRDSNPKVIRCTALALGSLSFGSDVWAMVVNPLTGAPVGDAEVWCRGDKAKKERVGVTNVDGLFAVSAFNGRRGAYYPVKGSDRFAGSRYINFYGTASLDTARRYYCEPYTDLPLYHPGDTLRFAAVLYSIKERDYRVEPGRALTAVLFDANRQEVDTLELATDSYGRVTGTFALPDDGRLNGRYSLRITADGITGWANFTVSDYKLPSFEVKVTDNAVNTPSKGDVTVKGSARTYSGMPVAAGRVTVRIVREMLWRWWQPDNGEFQPLELAATTDAAGDWQVVAPAAELAKGGHNAWFRAEVTITSADGESQAAQSVFTLGPSLRIEAPLAQSYDVTSPLTLPVRVVDTKGDVVPGVKVDYTVSRDDKAVASGSFTTDKPQVDWSAVTPGTYQIEFAIEGDTARCNAVALYRPDVDRSPSQSLLWTPTHTVNLSVEGTTDILLGTSMDTTHVLYTLYDYEEIIERRWLALPAGLHRIEAATRRGGEPSLRASFIAVGRYASEEQTISFRPAINPRDLKIKAEVMRDRLTPGAEETWRFSVVNATGTPVAAAVMLDMYNKALDALTPGGWYLNVASPASLSLRWNQPIWDRMTNIWLGSYGDNRLKTLSYHLPEWQLYGQTLSPQTFRNGLRIRGTATMKSAAPAPAAVESVYAVDEMADEAANVVEHKSALGVIGSAKEDSAELTEEEAAADAGAGSAEQSQSGPEVAYRDSETPLALFRPMLVTGPDGSLTLTFTVPNANATWALNALAWTDDMRAARMEATILASKPVMVKPNAPRFLREGDKAVILTSVMNATDSAMKAMAVIELFDPATGKTLSTVTESVDLAPQATVIVPVTAEAAPGLTMIGLRAKASTADFADGEQLVMPVLPAATPVIDSEPFYLGPDTHHAEVTMPAPKDATDVVTTLEFCENPVWYVVTALPGLAAEEPVSAPQAADALFSAAVARGLLSRYPVIAEALREWTARGASSEELTSMLERNDDLKQLALAATPWMMDARSDTERMQRLALLFDEKRVEKSINTAIGLLSRLERGNGGWAWIAAIDEPSQWATESVLSVLATLDQYGFTPSDDRLAAMTAKAVKFVDTEAVKNHRRSPEAPMVGYAMLRTCFPQVAESSEVQSIVNQAVQAVVKGWKEWPLAQKPQAAMLLYRRDYKAVAAQILQSMREFMVTTPDKGSFFPSLQNRAWGYIGYTADALRAFALIEPGAPEVDGLRHWLVVQKQATDWGSSAAATDVVAAILASSQTWLADAQGATVCVDGRRVAVPAIDRRLGYFRLPVAAKADGEVSVTVDKPADTPAWGAVIRRSVQPLRSVEAASCDDISIEKTVIGSDSLALGRKVTVRLLVRVNRNLNYVTITDARAACFEPVSQLPSVQFAEGVCFYLEPRDSQTDIFVTTMPKGTYVITYDLYVNNAGSFASGIATASSQYEPGIAARSAGSVLTVR